MVKKNKKDIRLAKIYAIALVVGIATLVGASMLVYNNRAGAEVISNNEGISFTVSENLASKFLAKLGLVDEDIAVGTASGPDKFNHQRFLANHSVGGGGSFATSSTATAYTLTTAELKSDRRESYLSWTPNVSTTLTTMASSSAPLADLKVGESYSVYFYNASTTAASTVTFAAGTGVDLQEDEGETVIVNGLEISKLTFIKKADTDVILWVSAGQVGD